MSPRKRFLVIGAMAVLLGVMTGTIAAASAPSLLRVTGPVLCDAGSRFVVDVGPTVDAPDNKRVAPVHFGCVDARGAVVDARIGAAVAVVVIAAILLWWVVLALAVRRLLRPSRPLASASHPR